MIRRIPASAVALILATAPAAAQKPPASGETMAVHPEAKAAIDRIKSPYCPGMMLEVCTSEGGAMLRDSAQSWADQGLSADSIVERVVSAYGEEYRAEPLSSGTGLWAWILPPAALLVGLGGVGIVLARRRRSEPPSGMDPAPVDPEDEARLRAAIRKIEEEEEPVF
jgi:cytochrome c-type biogenesis protein CcmH/NrfF